jgi:tetrahydromethanopterin S-methyltransferase subunit F
MPPEDDDIDLDKVVWDVRYRRQVIERLNRQVAVGSIEDSGDAPPDERPVKDPG